MAITRSDMTNMERLLPTVEITVPTTPGFKVAVVVYDVEITDDPTGTNPDAYVIRIPGEMNNDDVSGTRLKRLAFIMGIWYLQTQIHATLMIDPGLVPNSMSIGNSYAVALVDDYDIGRPHIYHPGDTRYVYPYNVGSDIEDDDDRCSNPLAPFAECPKMNPKRWDGIKEFLKDLFKANFVRTLIYAGVLGYLACILLDKIGPQIGACTPGVVAGSQHSVTCTDGSICNDFLYLGADCVTYAYDCCTGTLKPQTEPPKGWTDIVPWVIGGGVAIGIVVLIGMALSKKKEKAQPGVVYTLGGGYTPPSAPPAPSVPPAGAAPYTPPPPPPIGSTIPEKPGLFKRIGGAMGY